MGEASPQNCINIIPQRLRKMFKNRQYSVAEIKKSINLLTSRDFTVLEDYHFPFGHFPAFRLFLSVFSYVHVVFLVPSRVCYSRQELTCTNSSTLCYYFSQRLIPFWLRLVCPLTVWFWQPQNPVRRKPTVVSRFLRTHCYWRNYSITNIYYS